jgi:hypothetical protein
MAGAGGAVVGVGEGVVNGHRGRGVMAVGPHKQEDGNLAGAPEVETAQC